MITLSIDVTQIDKTRLKEITRKNGQKAKFLELILIETPDGQYGDYMVKQGITKEEREARVEMPILGNGKNVGGGNRQQSRPVQRQPKMDEVFNDDSSEIPF
jgi:hypothetical protein